MAKLRPKRLLRRLLAGLTILSLILCLATVTLWVRSYWRHDVVEWVGDEGRLYRCGVRSTSGDMSPFVFTGNFVAETIGAHGWRYVTGPSASLHTFESFTPIWFFGFGYVDPTWPGNDGYRALCVPHWSFALLFAVLPAVRVRSIIRSRRRFSAGLCPACGYDLRATPDRCPECGAASVRGS